MNSEIKELKDMMQRIELALCGDEKAGITGIVKKVQRHEEKLKFVERAQWALSGAIVVITVLWELLK